MIGITVLLAASLAFSLSSTTEPSDDLNADVAIEAGSALDARHVGGEDIPVEGSFFVVTLDDGEERIALADLPGDVSEGRSDHWELGEEVCVSCEADGEVQALTFTTEHQVLLEWTRPP